jgi:hypothetical protein
MDQYPDVIIRLFQGSDPQTLQIRWMHQLRMKKLGGAAERMREVRGGAPGVLNVEALKRTTLMSKLATLAALPPGSLSMP